MQMHIHSHKFIWIRVNCGVRLCPVCSVRWAICSILIHAAVWQCAAVRVAVCASALGSVRLFGSARGPYDSARQCGSDCQCAQMRAAVRAEVCGNACGCVRQCTCQWAAVHVAMCGSACGTVQLSNSARGSMRQCVAALVALCSCPTVRVAVCSSVRQCGSVRLSGRAAMCSRAAVCIFSNKNKYIYICLDLYKCGSI
jgi:hypothetical protein